MSSDAILGLLLRSLPTIGLIILGFVATNDMKTRRQWTKFLYSVGSLRADQQEDAKKQASVKWPFFIMAALFLWLPFSYYKLATRKIGMGEESDLLKKSEPAAAAPAATPTPKPTPSGPTPPPAPLRPGESAPAATAAPAPITAPNAPAAAKTPPPNVGGPGPHL